MGLYVQYGSGLSAPEGWRNYDVSPSLRAQRMPVIGGLFRSMMSVKWPANTFYGDILEGLPDLKRASVTGLYCSHVLEHLALDDFRIALKQSYDLLAPGGIFRLVMPDLEQMVLSYQNDLKEGRYDTGIGFIRSTIMAYEHRPRTFMGFLRDWKGNARHLWLWDQYSTRLELEKVGFKAIRTCQFGDCEDPMFAKVEEPSRFVEALAMEARK